MAVLPDFSHLPATALTSQNFAPEKTKGINWLRAGETTLHLRASTVLAEAPSSVPNIHVGISQPPVPGIWRFLLAYMGPYMYMVHINSYKHTPHTHTNVCVRPPNTHMWMYPHEHIHKQPQTHTPTQNKLIIKEESLIRGSMYLPTNDI